MTDRIDAHPLSFAETLVDVTLQEGILAILGPADLIGEPDDVIEVYFGDNIVGHERLPPALAGGMVACDVAITDLRPATFPCALRLVNARLDREIDAALTIGSAEILMSLMGDPHVTAAISAIGPERITFTLTLARLHPFARRFELRFNGRDIALAESAPHRDAASGTHGLTFNLQSVIRDGTRIELVDLATQQTVFTVAATWMNLVWPLAIKLDTLEKRLDESERELTNARQRVNELMDLSGERQLLDRLDLFYFLLNDRFDRELARQSPPASPDAPAGLPASLRIAPRMLEGVGFYDVERTAHSEWRWLGPRVMFVLRDVAGVPTRLVITLFRLHGHEQSAAIAVNVNDVAVAPRVAFGAQEQVTLDIPILADTARLDGLLIFQLHFPKYIVSEGDGRLLSAVFSEATLLFEKTQPPPAAAIPQDEAAPRPRLE
jgi:hypothetical protein